MRDTCMKIKSFFQLYIDPISFVCGIFTGVLILIIFFDISACKESLSFLWDAIGAVGTVLAAIIAVLTYRSSVKRQKKQDTIREFSRIREKYPNLSPQAPNPVPDEERIKYLKEMERFCTGVNIGLYDIHVVDRIAGAMLITQYDKYLRDFIEKRRQKTVQNAQTDSIYCEYIKLIEKIQKYH